MYLHSTSTSKNIAFLSDFFLLYSLRCIITTSAVSLLSLLSTVKLKIQLKMAIMIKYSFISRNILPTYLTLLLMWRCMVGGWKCKLTFVHIYFPVFSFIHSFLLLDTEIEILETSPSPTLYRKHYIMACFLSLFDHVKVRNWEKLLLVSSWSSAATLLFCRNFVFTSPRHMPQLNRQQNNQTKKWK